MLLEVKVPAEALLTDLASEGLVLVVGVHVKRQVVDLKVYRWYVSLKNCFPTFSALSLSPLSPSLSPLSLPLSPLPHLMERLVAYVALVGLLPRMGQPVVLVVALLMEALSAELASVGTVTLRSRYMENNLVKNSRNIGQKFATLVEA